MEVVAVKFAGIGSSQTERVHDRGITLQRLAFAEAVFKYARHMRPLLWSRSLAFHERSERHDILNAVARRSAGGRQGQPLLPEFLDHGGCHVFPRHVARKFVGRGEKKTFKARRVDSDVTDRRRIMRGDKELVAREETFVRGKVRDIEHREALGNSQFLHVDAPIRERVIHIEGAHGMVKEILAGL